MPSELRKWDIFQIALQRHEPPSDVKSKRDKISPVDRENPAVKSCTSIVGNSKIKKIVKIPIDTEHIYRYDLYHILLYTDGESIFITFRGLVTVFAVWEQYST